MKRAFAWSMAGQIGSIGLLFLLSVVVTRFLSPAEVGVYATGAAITGIVTGLLTNGLQAFVIRAERFEPAVRDTVFTVNMLLSLAFAGVMVLLSAGTTWLGWPAPIAPVLLILAVRVALFALELLPTALAQRVLRFRLYAGGVLTSAATNLVVTMALVLAGFGAKSLAIGVVAGAVAQLAVYLVAAPRLLACGLGLTGWREVVAFGGQMLLIGGTSTITKRLSELIVGAFLGVAALGLFTRATVIADGLFFALFGSLSRVIFARFSEGTRSGRDFADQYLPNAELLLSLFVPLVFGVAVLAGPIIRLMFGEPWLSAAPVLVLMMAWQWLALAFPLNWEVFVIRHRTKRQSWIEFVRAAASLIGVVVGSGFGLNGAAAGRLADVVLGAAIYIPAIIALVPVSPSAFLRLQLRGLVLGAATVAPALAVMIYYQWRADAPLPSLAVAVAAGMGVWLCGLWAMGSPLWHDTAAAVRDWRKA